MLRQVRRYLSHFLDPTGEVADVRWKLAR